jgi:hypothetical protein
MRHEVGYSEHWVEAFIAAIAPRIVWLREAANEKIHFKHYARPDPLGLHD